MTDPRSTEEIAEEIVSAWVGLGSRDELSEMISAALTSEREWGVKIEAHAQRMSDALTKVRPLGGSELFTRVGEKFYADPDYCGAAIEELRTNLHEARVAEAKSRKAALQSGPTP